MLGAEGLHQTGSAIASIRQFFLLGVRYITLTHNCDNAYATAASTVTAGGEDIGLKDFGYAAVREMNRIGMMVDLSHVSHNTMRDVLRVTRSPVMFSHSSCYTLAKNYRNVPDDVLRSLKANGGVIMVMFVTKGRGPSQSQQTLLACMGSGQGYIYIYIYTYIYIYIW